MLNKNGKRRIAIGRVDFSSSLRLAPLVQETIEPASAEGQDILREAVRLLKEKLYKSNAENEKINIALVG
ncbi:MAG: hypothetical protein LH614_07940 [Pyrinomonadaceae bacterium]|nr:hypothetical protein [Pyrinomonadaceae bacterium]